ncbi:MGMT family protein [Actinoalloteichus hymeniacidonis]|uniref:Methylated DNA-protein cysteine methyltransferase n=1 Tax=Actinoalloteichus hymeniacidonis TaxID=340345 RepID=A0AAC9HM82_9PSEU|nr:MGMT family protein [Actinoalloteichus hymeniacidonis]AOS61793.1 putative methylated DNA-protein cysteine methyltransferase [Actinoalloteichus hymeniacidonis]MBB5910188.1 alkylated DNA nucleotide flippase Atl1 [Actinoalloteichus hymeniacidonis]
MSEEMAERVREVVASIPAGRVLAYGEVGAIAGVPSPRYVGAVLADDGADLPWHRVLRANGTVASHLAGRQLELLAAEGVLAENSRVDMSRYRWTDGLAAAPTAEEGLW